MSNAPRKYIVNGSAVNIHSVPFLIKIQEVLASELLIFTAYEQSISNNAIDSRPVL